MLVKAEGYIEKASKLAEGEVEVVVSTNDWDAHGERINVNGIDFKSYMKKNNVVLWGHDGFNLPIGNTTKMWVEGNKLMARAKLYLKDDFPRKVYQYIMDGVVKSVSIGGMVEEWASDGLTIDKLTMKEFSFVPVPANENAIVTSKKLDGNEKAELKSLANAYARKVLTKELGGSELKDDISRLKTLVTTLEEIALGETKEESVDELTNRRVVLRSAQAVDQQVETVIRRIKLKGNSNE